MDWSFLFFLNSVLFGAGLAMDALSVSVADGLSEPGMKRSKAFLIAGVFALFQTAMPLIGWFCVSSIASVFQAVVPFIPWIALALLLFLGIKMIIEGLRKESGDKKTAGLTLPVLLLQGLATSIDALSVGFTISEYTFAQALVESIIIGAVTFGICLAGILVGRKAGGLFKKAPVIGGAILIAIGIEIFVSHLIK